MDLETARFLLTDTGTSIIEAASDAGDDPLSAGRLLRKQFASVSVAHLSGAIEVVSARRQAQGKLPYADKLFLTREAVEQSTSHKVASHRAERYRNATGAVHDCCCGIGGDAFALGNVTDNLICMDRDPVRVLFCRENLRRIGVEADVVEADVATYADRIESDDLVVIDPSRRTSERRTVRLEAMSPPISEVAQLIMHASGSGVKLPPGLDVKELGLPGELEWISTAEGLKEAVLWTGSLVQNEVSVTLLHRGCTLTSGELPGESAGVQTPGMYLYEPDPALIRSGLLARKAAVSDMWPIDPEIAYLSSNDISSDPFFTGYRILESLPFNLKRLREVLRSYDAGRLVVKKRGFPLSPEELERKLGLDGSTEMMLIATRIADGHHIFIVERLPCMHDGL